MKCFLVYESVDFERGTGENDEVDMTVLVFSAGADVVVFVFVFMIIYI